MHLHSIKLGAVRSGKVHPLLPQTLLELMVGNHYVANPDFFITQMSAKNVISASTTTLLM
jgi:hypothetical protein